MTDQTILPEFSIPAVDPEAMKVWAAALRDPNPIHLDRETVAARGLGDRRINQGPANVAYVMNMLMAAFPDHRIASLDVRYVGNVLEGDAVTAGGVVTDRVDDDLHCDVWLKIDGGQAAVTGRAVMRITRAIG